MYSHQSISREKAEIRLARFATKCSEDQQPRISLELESVSLADVSVRYSALSYVWGDMEKGLVEIEVDGSPFRITQNLYTGLENLLRTIDQRDIPWFWVDAICINQSDQIERTWQVAQMHKTYKRADLVYMLLGPGSSNTDRAMEFISTVGTQAVTSGVLSKPLHCPTLRKRVHDAVLTQTGNPLKSSKQDENEESEFSQFMYELLKNERLYPTTAHGKVICAGLSEILRKDYWHRIWIVPEVALASNATVICGGKGVSLDAFEGIILAILFCRGLDLGKLEEYSRFAVNIGANVLSVIPLTIRRQHGKEPIKLVDLLFQTTIAPYRPHYSASDPRDIVFALLGIVSDSKKLGLKVDYNWKCADVFTALTRAFIRHGDSGELAFHLDRCVPREDDGNDMPSWVPDWTDIGQNGLSVYPINYYGTFHSSGGNPPPQDDCHSRSPILRRLGCYVDTITEVMPPPIVRKNQWSFSYIEDPKKWLKSIMDFTKLGPDSGLGEDYIWRTVMKGQFYSNPGSFSCGSGPLHEVLLNFNRKLMRQEPMDAETLEEEVAKFVSEGIFCFSKHDPASQSLSARLSYVKEKWPSLLGTICRERTLFKTAKDMLGLGHVTIKPGDHVTLLWGIDSPIILRPLSGRDTSDDFRFLGDAYVDGIMQGEYLNNNPAHMTFDIK